MKFLFFKRKIKNLISKKSIIVFLLFVVIYTIGFNLWFYEFAMNSYFLGFGALNIFSAIFILFLTSLIFSKHRLLTILAFIFSFIIVTSTFNSSVKIINIARIFMTEKSKLPKYGTYILWGYHGSSGLSSTVFTYLINVKITDDQALNRIGNKLNIDPDLINLEPITDEYLLLTEIH